MIAPACRATFAARPSNISCRASDPRTFARAASASRHAPAHRLLHPSYRVATRSRPS
ncbi:A/G-specific adenine glycosylase [Caballeronia sordidicola]|uniref:A/G-specific adenine glycosylase n=1 Tax=Caballeronia sordidicola TaxID=196367 RepID=A0A242M3Z0_CABSO|nr:A/G-specific adenine glycosylase [Caballeronia sordidicola]